MRVGEQVARLADLRILPVSVHGPDPHARNRAPRRRRDRLGVVVATGEDDVNRYRFFDDDTKCIFQVHGGPSNVDNDLIGKCAKGAHDLIGPEQIKVTAGVPAAAGSGT